MSTVNRLGLQNSNRCAAVKGRDTADVIKASDARRTQSYRARVFYCRTNAERESVCEREKKKEPISSSRTEREKLLKNENAEKYERRRDDDDDNPHGNALSTNAPLQIALRETAPRNRAGETALEINGARFRKSDSNRARFESDAGRMRQREGERKLGVASGQGRAGEIRGED